LRVFRGFKYSACGAHRSRPWRIPNLMTRSPSWARLGFDMMALSAEASGVIALRMMRLGAGGPAAAAEAERMVAEKVRAAAELQSRAWVAAVTGSAPVSPSVAIAHYRRKVRANRRRLSR
jgi:hypothetical protein